MLLRDALTSDAVIDAHDAAREVSGVTADSRTLKPGDIFVALAGSKTDGGRFIDAAAQSGAAAVVGEGDRPASLAASVAYVRVANARRVLATAAARFHPRRPATIAAVTGTSGKTSVAAFVRQMWQALGHASASIGTVGVVTQTREEYGSLTTPDPVALARTIDGLAGEGITHLCVEASSHGLDQHRLDGLRVNIGAFTNLSRDHLDYHPDVEAYFAAKLRLFADLVMDDGVAVVNVDDPYGGEVEAAARARGLAVVTVGRAGEGLRLLSATRDGFGQLLRVGVRGREHALRLPLVGAFQIENALVAAGIAIAAGGDPATVCAAVEKLEGAKGRLEHVGTRNGAPVFVDYAHKPDALAKALEALRPYADGALVVVIGAGGDRDKGKRPLMGAIAAEKADRVIVTDDNPRSEDPARIRAEILAAAPGAIEIGDRAEAIRRAVTALEPGDVLVVAGKGHESGQIIGDRVLPFSDHEAVTAALGDHGA